MAQTKEHLLLARQVGVPAIVALFFFVCNKAIARGNNTTHKFCVNICANLLRKSFITRKFNHIYS